MTIEGIAHITCFCGAEFQVLNEDGTDWDEGATAELYREHLRQVHGGV